MTQLEHATKVMENFANGVKYDPSTVAAAVVILNRSLNEDLVLQDAVCVLTRAATSGGHLWADLSYGPTSVGNDAMNAKEVIKSRPVNYESPHGRHGGAFDRGSADAWYARAADPHYFKGATHQSERVGWQDMTSGELHAYWYAYLTEPYNQKDWG